MTRLYILILEWSVIRLQKLLSAVKLALDNHHHTAFKSEQTHCYAIIESISKWNSRTNQIWLSSCCLLDLSFEQMLAAYWNAPKLNTDGLIRFWGNIFEIVRLLCNAMHARMFSIWYNSIHSMLTKFRP